MTQISHFLNFPHFQLFQIFAHLRCVYPSNTFPPMIPHESVLPDVCKLPVSTYLHPIGFDLNSRPQKCKSVRTTKDLLRVFFLSNHNTMCACNTWFCNRINYLASGTETLGCFLSLKWLHKSITEQVSRMQWVVLKKNCFPSLTF